MIIEPRTHVARNLFAIDLQLDVQNDCEGLQHKFQHADYLTRDPLIIQPLQFHHK